MASPPPLQARSSPPGSAEPREEEPTLPIHPNFPEGQTAEIVRGRMKDTYSRLYEALDTLDSAARRQAGDWHAIAQAERRPLRPADLKGVAPDRMVELERAGWLELHASSSWLPWQRGAGYRATDDGRDRLKHQREELETLQTAIRGSLLSGWDALVAKGIDPATFALERMILLHGRFADRSIGFLEGADRLSKIVRDEEAAAMPGGSDDDATLLSALGIVLLLD